MNKFLMIVFSFLFIISVASKVYSMSWELVNVSDDRFVVSFIPEEIFLRKKKETRVNLIIRCNEKSLKVLPQELQQLFKKSDDKFVYSLFDIVNDNHDSEPDTTKFIPMEQKLVCKDTPAKMTCEELKAIIRTKKVIFYTGAGISAQAIPTMNILMQYLGMSEDLEYGNKLQQYICEVINNPGKYTKILQDFFDRCRNAPPTTAHTLLAKCVKKFGHLLVTENVDQLHQNSGIEPTVFAGHDRYSENAKIIEAAKKSEFIITIGLNSDESGFLKFYKIHNPKGKIISVNLISTNYLSDRDFYVEGDIQEIAKEIF